MKNMHAQTAPPEMEGEEELSGCPIQAALNWLRSLILRLRGSRATDPS